MYFSVFLDTLCLPPSIVSKWRGLRELGRPISVAPKPAIPSLRGVANGKLLDSSSSSRGALTVLYRRIEVHRVYRRADLGTVFQDLRELDTVFQGTLVVSIRNIEHGPGLAMFL